MISKFESRSWWGGVTRYNVVWYTLSVTCDRSMVYPGTLVSSTKQNWPPRCNWHIVVSGVKHHTIHYPPPHTHILIQHIIISEIMTILVWWVRFKYNLFKFIYSMIVKVISKIKIESRNHLIHMTNTGMSLGLTEMFHKAWYSSGFLSWTMLSNISALDIYTFQDFILNL